MVKIYLTDRWVTAPVYWKNFVKSIKAGHTPIGNIETVLNNSLKEYNAVHEYRYSTLTFDSDADLIVFKLKYA